MKDIIQKKDAKNEETEKIKEKSEKTKEDQPQTTISWEALEYPHFEKSTLWYSVLAIIAAVFIVIAFALGDIILVILVIFGTITIGVLGSRIPEKITVEFNGTTLHVGDETDYNLEEMKSFWIHYEPPEDPELLFHSSRFFAPLILIPMGDQDPLKLRKYLRKLLPEEHKEMPLTQRIARYLKF